MRKEYINNKDNKRIIRKQNINNKHDKQNNAHSSIDYDNRNNEGYSKTNNCHSQRNMNFNINKKEESVIITRIGDKERKEFIDKNENRKKNRQSIIKEEQLNNDGACCLIF